MDTNKKEGKWCKKWKCMSVRQKKESTVLVSYNHEFTTFLCSTLFWTCFLWSHFCLQSHTIKIIIIIKMMMKIWRWNRMVHRTARYIICYAINIHTNSNKYRESLLSCQFAKIYRHTNTFNRPKKNLICNIFFCKMKVNIVGC